MEFLKGSFIIQGCYRLVMNFILENLSKIGVTIMAAAFIHILGVALTCLLARTISKANYEEIRWGCRGQDEKHTRESSSLDEQKQPLTSKGNHSSTTPLLAATTAAEVLSPPPPPPTWATLQQAAQHQSSNNPCAAAMATGSVVSSCAGCVQQLQQQCQQQQQQEAMEMTAILHSQPPLQLVSCHGPIMHPSTPSNQRWEHWEQPQRIKSFLIIWSDPQRLTYEDSFHNSFLWPTLPLIFMLKLVGFQVKTRN